MARQRVLWFEPDDEPVVVGRAVLEPRFVVVVNERGKAYPSVLDAELNEAGEFVHGGRVIERDSIATWGVWR